MHELHAAQELKKRGAAEATPPCYDRLKLRLSNFWTALRMMSVWRELRGNRNLRPAYFIIRRFLIIARRQGQSINHTKVVNVKSTN